jgi:glycosyltransferase involved in cell wall biosynthesis
MLATDAHGGSGGIAQYNRNVLDALSELEHVGEVVVVPRIVGDLDFTLPPKVRYVMAGIGGLLSYLRTVLQLTLCGGRFDLVYCAHINLMPAAALAARILRAPSVLVIHGVDAWEPPPGKAAALCARLATLVISVSQITLDRFLAWCPINRSATALVPNSIRLDRFGPGPKDAELCRHLGLASRKVVMTFGRMAADERYKGFDEVIDVLPRLRRADPSICYLAVGDGDDRPRLEARARETGVADIVVFTGHVPEARKADYFRLADAFVMPSTGEGFGIVILEALACGIPVVASLADGTREAVRDGKLGLVVDPKDEAALERAIIEALSRPKEVLRGLEVFSFASFAARLQLALGRVVPV